MQVQPGATMLRELTPLWTGDRFDDGRPKVPDPVLVRLRSATTEQAWGVLRQAGYHRQFAGGWVQTHPGTVLVGRALTSVFVPHRPDFDQVVVAAGARAGQHAGRSAELLGDRQPGHRRRPGHRPVRQGRGRHHDR